MTKTLKGLYETNRQVYLIKLPYLTRKWIFAGSRNGAKREGEKLTTKLNHPYPAQIKQIL